MSNNLASNTTTKVARVFLAAFEKQRVLSKAVNTNVLKGEFTPASGSTIYVKRPHQYTHISTTGGDISQSTKSDILSGSTPATVQNYITVAIEWTNKEEALQLDQLETILAPAAETAVIALETALCDYMIKYSGLSYGTPGTAVDAWSDVAGAGALMKGIGVPQGGDFFYVMNPFTAVALADVQNGLYGGRLMETAWENAQVSSNFAGMKVLSSNSLSTYTSGTLADKAGAFNAAPNATWATHKDTLVQTWVLKGLTASQTPAVSPGDVLEVTGKYYVHPRTGKIVLGADGAGKKFRASCVTGGNTDSSGIVSIAVAGPGIYESGGQYNNINAALAEDDVVTILGATNTIYQPNLFFKKDAFGITTIALPKLFSTDTVATTNDGISLRVCKYADGDANTQMIRFDLLPAFACFNPFFAGKGFGV